MKKNKAFTLVELLAVIVVLAIILALVVPKVFRTIDESKKRTCNIQVDYLEDAAETYFVKHRYNNTEDGISYDQASKSVNGVDILLIDLSNASLIKGKVTNPLNDHEFDKYNTKINIKNVDDEITYTVLVYNSQDSAWEVFDCD